jgi:hypothetical protein
MRVRAFLVLLAVWSGGCSGGDPLPADGGSNGADVGAPLGADAAATVDTADATAVVDTADAAVAVDTADGGAAVDTAPGAVVDCAPELDGPSDVNPALAGIKLATTFNDFGSIEINKMSAPFTFVVANTGTGVAGKPQISISSGDFIQTNDCDAIPGGGTCKVTVVFRPTSVGSKQGTLMVTSVPGGSAYAALYGSGVMAALWVNPDIHDFGGAQIGTQSDPLTFTVANTGGAILGGLNVSLSGADFVAPAVGNKCAALTSLAPGASCVVGVQFKPTSRGVKTGSLTASGGGQTVTATFTGHGMTPAALAVSPMQVDLAGRVGQTSLPVTITVGNVGDAATGAIMIALGGANPGDFKITSNGCLAPLAFGASCQFAVAVNAATAGMKAATATASSNVGGMATATLSATVVTP